MTKKSKSDSAPNVFLSDSVSLRERIVAVLREAILTGAVAPGERINEQKFADQLRVSRPPLREAIRVLEKDGLLVSTPRKGTNVRKFNGTDILEIYEARFAIELCAAIAVTRLQNEEIFCELEKSLDLAFDSELELPEIITTDLQFHRLLVKSCGNSKLLEMWDQLAGQLRLALVMIDPQYFKEEFVVKTHYRQISAMRRGDFAEVQSLIGGFDEIAQSLKQRWESLKSI